ncbi:unnamed protein product [Miscanthus lutarioriparius]|uniref:non-specific serine/threonine protein kinase n=1 Tax=Miscanthus lutarioriparius TaxID=422564 RepID=A0A811N2G0_9POAL|nr:unnamed protein product [Miscanthus lutarioriparius]
MLTDVDLSLESTASPALEDARNVGDKGEEDVPDPAAPTCLPIPELQLLRLRRWKRRCRESNEATLRNIVRRPLEFPAAAATTRTHGVGDSAAARDLIARLLDKDPRTRLGSKRGAADVKAHGFFKGLNFALLRSAPPPVVPPPAALHRCDKAADVQQLFDHF